ncbi:MAG: inositol monophosphatase [Actinomycetales bacterium]|nr:inositol monophosphatase [Actinomycetales bacterium]
MSFAPVHSRAELAAAVEIAQEAGQLLAARPETLELDTKTSKTDIVTHMDKLAEELIVGKLRSNFPKDGILGEEGAEYASESGFQWVIDPLDGTINYLYGLPAWAVSIARLELKTGLAQVGVVSAPNLGKTYFASAGNGSFELHSQSTLEVGTCKDLSHALIGTGFSYQSTVRAGQARILTDLLPTVRDIRRIGSCALDLCFVAEGLLDGFFERKVNLWDHAAGGLIAREAGALVSGLRGQVESFDMLVATNRHLANELTGLLEALDADSDRAVNLKGAD